MRNFLLGKLLILLLIISAFGAIYSSFANRQLAHEWQKLQESQNKMQEEYGRLMLEYSTLAAPSRIEQIARNQLNMVFPKKQDTQVLNIKNGVKTSDK